MFNAKKWTALILAAALLIPALGCTDKTDINKKATEDSVIKNEITEENESKELTNNEKLQNYVDSIPQKDYEQYEFVIITRNEKDNPYWFTQDVYVESQNGETINDSIYERNRIIEEKFNIIIRDNPVANPSTTAKKKITSGEDSFALVTDGLCQLAITLAVPQLLIDYKTVPGIELDNEWWDQRMNKEMTVKQKLYFVTGDVSIMDNEGTWNFLFNKDLHNQFNLDDYYEMRDSGTWTIDIVHKDALKVASDVDGDGIMNPETDIYGLSTEPWNTYAFWAGAGCKVTTKNSDDMPENSLDLNADKRIIFDHNDPIYGDIIFYNGLSLYNLVGMRALPKLRSYEMDFGIMPLPKYNEEQEKYYSVSSHINLTAYSIPITSADPERTGIILEALAGVSKYTLTYAYYDIALTHRYFRDDDSRASIDMILSNRSYDLGIIFCRGNSINEFIDMTNKDTRDFSSRCAKMEPIINANIEEFAASIG